jgi:hypothetical protein
VKEKTRKFSSDRKATPGQQPTTNKKSKEIKKLLKPVRGNQLKRIFNRAEGKSPIRRLGSGGMPPWSQSNVTLIAPL